MSSLHHIDFSRAVVIGVLLLAAPAIAFMVIAVR